MKYFCYLLFIAVLSACTSNNWDMETARVENDEVSQLVRLEVKETLVEPFYALLLQNKALTLQEDGNIMLEVYQSRTKRNVFFVFSHWQNKQAILTHNQYDYSRMLVEKSRAALKSKPDVYILQDKVTYQTAIHMVLKEL